MRSPYDTRLFMLYTNEQSLHTLLLLLSLSIDVLAYVEEQRALGTEPWLRDHRKR